MANELKVIPGTQIALFRMSGHVEFKDRIKNVKRIARFCHESSIKHLIVDIREQVSETHTMQMFSLGALVPELLRGVKIAVVCHSLDEETQFGETVAANRRAISRSFTSFEEAQKWLEGED